MKKKSILLGILFITFTSTSIVAKNFIESDKSPIEIFIPSTGEKAYAIAGETFADMWEKVTGERPSVSYLEADQKELSGSNVVLIGSDAVNPVVHEFMRTGLIDGLGLQFGGDNYRLLSLNKEGKNYLILAGGSGRSTIYAVYDFFRKQAGVEYFWDGDVIPPHESIDISGIDILEKPRFEYRGLRYFAHRGLHRFQAEHWDLDDWKKEIDWLMKERFNMFMLRTGIDDLFQRAFPDDVYYPPVNGKDPDGGNSRDYFDRTSFWQLKYRGELRKKVLEYARDRGLLHPEDVGTITHWYSHTPSSFFKSNPDFPVITNQKSGYSLPTQAIWEIEKQEAWDAYWKLTQTHIKEYGGGYPRLFHTIGLAERMFGGDRENFQRKMHVYRKIQNMFRDQYPDIPLLIASWDFLSRWKNEEVQSLLTEFDPNRTIILDYTADNISFVSYRDWGMYKKFPWIFGVIHSFAKNSDIHGNYDDIITPRLKEAALDSMCKGFVIWSEISHSDTYLLEYLADNSWQPERAETKQATQRYCESRYPSEAVDEMNTLWESFLTLSQSHNWGLGGTVREPQFRILKSTEFINLTSGQIDNLNFDFKKLYPGLKESVKVLSKLAEMAKEYYGNPLWQRDATDMARTIASNALYMSLAKGAVQMEEWRNKKADASDIRELAKLSKDLLATLSDIVSMSDDFSMYTSLQKLSDAKPIEGIAPTVNSHSEQTLKANSENGYCRSHHYELVEHVYRPELEVYWDWVLKRIKSGDRSEWKRPKEFSEKGKIIEDKFYETSLKVMAPPTKNRNAKSFSKVLLQLNNQVNELLETER